MTKQKKTNSQPASGKTTKSESKGANDSPKKKIVEDEEVDDMDMDDMDVDYDKGFSFDDEDEEEDF